MTSLEILERRLTQVHNESKARDEALARGADLVLKMLQLQSIDNEMEYDTIFGLHRNEVRDPVFFKADSALGRLGLIERIQRLESEVDILHREVTTTETTLTQAEAAIIDVIEIQRTNEAALIAEIDAIRTEQESIQEVANTVDWNQAINQTVDTLNTVKEVADATTENLADVPLIGGTLASAAQYVSSGAWVIGKGVEWAKARHIGTLANAAQRIVRFSKTLNADAARDATLGETIRTSAFYNARELKHLTDLWNRAIAHQDGAISKDIVGAPEPRWFYFLTPLPAPYVGRFARNLSASLLNHLPDALSNRIIDTMKIPAHGLVVLIYSLTATRRRKIMLSTGSFEPFLNLAVELVTTQPNFVKWNDWIEDLVGGEWVVHEMGGVKVNSDGTPWTDPGLVGPGIEILHGDTIVDVHSARAFLDCMVELEQPYNLFTHNCQTQSLEFINFLRDGSLPHWWLPRCSANTLHARYTERYAAVDVGAGEESVHVDDGHYDGVTSSGQTMVSLRSDLDTVIASETATYIGALATVGEV
jgi:hypothetical protein